MTALINNIGAGALRTYKVSSNQDKMLVFESIYKSNCYNISLPIMFIIDADRTAFVASRIREVTRACFSQIEAFRTSFARTTFGFLAVVGQPESESELLSSDSAISDAEMIEKAQRAHAAPFDLTRGPLLRVTLISASGKLLVMMTTHHLVADGWSMALLAEAIAEAIEGRVCAPFDLGFSDSVTAVAEGNAVGLPELEQALERDIRRAGRMQALPGAARVMDTTGDEIMRAATAQEDEMVIAAARHARRTLAAHLFGAYCAAIGEVFGLERFVCLTNSMGPRTGRSARTIGYFSNVVPVPVHLAAEADARASFECAVERFDAYRKHRNVEFGAVLDTPIGRELRREGAIASFCFMQQKFKRLNGLAVSLTGLPAEGAKFAGLPLGSWHLVQQCGQFPLALEYIEAGQRFCGVAVKYRKRVVERSVAEHLAERVIAHARGARTPA